jgi:N-acetylglutamate synthase-like GNAT family acetyltransferase
MAASFRIEPIDGGHPGLTALAEEALSEGFRFVERLIADWHSGSNRFARPGERLLGAFWSGELVGVCGLNRDPYTDRHDVGRLRHLYVRKTDRHRGIGAALVQQLLKGASPPFTLIRLRTNTTEAAAFYERLGFRAVGERTATHAKALVGPGRA